MLSKNFKHVFPKHQNVKVTQFFQAALQLPLFSLLTQLSECGGICCKVITQEATSYYWIRCWLIGVPGRETTIATRPNSPPATTARRRPRTVWSRTRQLQTSRWPSWHPHTQSDSGWHSTSPYSTTRSSTRRIARAGWQRRRSTTRSRSWTRWARNRTRTRLSSCSCCETTSLCGRLTSREKVSIVLTFVVSSSLSYTSVSLVTYWLLTVHSRKKHELYTRSFIHSFYSLKGKADKGNFWQKWRVNSREF